MNNKPNNNSFVKVYLNVMDEILEKTKDPVSLAVYIAILRHRNTTTNKCFPSINRIAEIVGVSPSTIKRKIQKLYETEFLIINTGTKNVANNYYFPKENFFEDWNEDLEQLCATRKKKAFRKSKITKDEPIENDIECEENDIECEENEEDIY